MQNDEWENEQRLATWRLQREIQTKIKEQADWFWTVDELQTDTFYALGFRDGRLSFNDGGDWRFVTLKQSVELAAMMEKHYIESEYADEDVVMALRLKWFSMIARCL